MVQVAVDDGLYQAQSGVLEPFAFEDDGLKKLRVTPEVFEAVRHVQKQMRSILGGRKPDISLIVEALLLHAAKQEGIEEIVRAYAASVYSK